MSSPLVTRLISDRSLLSVEFATPPGNILDCDTIAALREVLGSVEPTVRTIVFSGQGRHFSFGASVEEHKPIVVNDMLPSFHSLFRDLADCGKVLIAAVQGQCLGGGLELAAFCQRVIASPKAKLGQPEIKLGVLAPVGSVVLPIRVGQANADDLLLTGRSVDANEALRMGLVDQIAEAPVEAAIAWHDAHIRPLSGAALALAIQAARWRLHRAVKGDLAKIEELYLGELMATHDASEGIASFLEKREPQWTHN